MKKFVLAGLGLTMIALPAAAADKVDPRVRAALACASIAQNDARLRCYDTTVPAMRQAVAAGNLISSNEAETPLALEGIVASTVTTGFNRFVVRLDTGDRWQVIADEVRDEPPRKGAKVQLHRGMGGYWLIEPNMPDRRATYLGRS